MLVNLHIYVAEFDKYVYYVLPGVYSTGTRCTV